MSEYNYEDDYNYIDKVTELLESQSWGGGNLSIEELASKLGVKSNEDGGFNSVALGNACLGVQDNEKVRDLPKGERLQVISSASSALSFIFGGGK